MSFFVLLISAFLNTSFCTRKLTVPQQCLQNLISLRNWCTHMARPFACRSFCSHCLCALFAGSSATTTKQVKTLRCTFVACLALPIHNKSLQAPQQSSAHSTWAPQHRAASFNHLLKNCLRASFVALICASALGRYLWLWCWWRGRGRWGWLGRRLALAPSDR